MSIWTEVTGIIRCDWISFSYPDKEKVHTDKLERLTLLTQLFDENNAPQGTEDSAIRAHYRSDDINTIVLLGSLRDFEEDDIKTKIVPWWNNIIDNLPFIRQAVMSCTSSEKTFIFEKRISSDNDLYPDECPLKRPDPGIIVCTEREISKLETENER